MVEKSTMTDQTAMLIVFLCFVFGIGIGIFTCIYFSKKVSFYNYYRLFRMLEVRTRAHVKLHFESKSLMYKVFVIE